MTEVELDKEERDVIKTFEKVVRTYKTTTVVERCDLGPIDTILRDNSNLVKIVNTIAYSQRWLQSRWYSVGRTGLKPGRSDYLDYHTKDKKFKYQRKPITAEEYDNALTTLIHHEQRGMDITKFKGYNLTQSEFVLISGTTLILYTLRSRVKNFPIKFSGKSEVVYPLPAGLLAKRIATYYHNRYHRDVDTVCHHIGAEFLIPQIRKIVTKIDKQCKFCLILRQKVIGQLMGDLPLCRSEPVSPFSSVSMDLFGPLTIKDSVIKRGARTRKKVWGVLFVCTSTRAVYIDIAEDYSTQSILHCIRRLMSDRGAVRRIFSDPGSQLVSADNVLKEVRQGWSEAELVQFGAKQGIEWSFTMASSQHQNGACERIIKMVKGIMRSLMEAIGTTVLFFNELLTLVKETANLVNERPIGIKPNKRTDPEYLSPNSLLLGRCSDRISSGPFIKKDSVNDHPTADRDRFVLVQKIVDQFWKGWTRLYFPTILWRQKWHVQERNVRVGDVVVVRDSESKRGGWRLGLISDVYPDINDVVRNIEISVAPPGLDSTPVYTGGTKIKLKRHVKNIIVIVPNEESCHSGHRGECEDEIKTTRQM